MQTIPVGLITAAIICGIAPLATEAVEPTAPIAVLPSRTSHLPMIRMWLVSPGPPSDHATTPDVAIYADGRIAVSADARSSRVTTGKLPQDQWQRLQRELFVKYHLLECETSVMDDEIFKLRRQRRRPAPGRDAAETVIKVYGANVDREIRCHAVGLTATQLPDLQCVQQLYACQNCLQNVIKVVRAGGYEQVEETLTTVNQRLVKQIPGTDPLSSDDLNLVDARPDGTKYLQFSRIPSSTGASGSLSGLRAHDRYLMVSVYERPGRPLEISIIGDTAAQ